jgi:hypothetical protein
MNLSQKVATMHVSETEDKRAHPKVNDRPRQAGDPFSQSMARESLKAIIEHYGYQVDDIPVKELDAIAQRLVEALGKDKHWGYRYLRNVINGKLKASEDLAGAIMRLDALIDGTPAQLVRSTPVQVLANGKVKAGAIILADSKPCAWLGCTTEFVPRVPWQKYCPEHSKRRKANG